MSKRVYVMNVLDMPDEVIKEVERMVSEFLWGGKGDRIAREVLENEYRVGGLKLVNLELKKSIKGEDGIEIFKEQKRPCVEGFFQGGDKQVWRVWGEWSVYANEEGHAG